MRRLVWSVTGPGDLRHAEVAQLYEEFDAAAPTGRPALVELAEKQLGVMEATAASRLAAATPPKKPNGWAKRPWTQPPRKTQPVTDKQLGNILRWANTEREQQQQARPELTFAQVKLSLAGWTHSHNGFGRPGVRGRLLSQKELACKLAAAGPPGAHLAFP